MNAGDAATYLGVPRPEVLQWRNGQSEPPELVMMKLYELIDRQERASDQIVKYWEDAGRPPEMELVVSKNNDDAQKAGWPCLTAERAPIAMAQALLVNVKIRFA